MTKRTILWASALVALGAAAACTSEPEGGLAGGKNGAGDPSATGDKDPNGLVGKGDEPTVLDERVVDYNEALRSASLKLLRVLPTLVQIKAVQSADDPQRAYEEQLDAMLDDVRFQERMIKWWRDTMRQGGGATADRPSRDTAPIFAARVMAEDRPYTELFTAATGTCPDYDADTHAFVDGDCDNGVPEHAGVLTNPGVMNQFYGNMAFRRVRWVQEIFVCTKFPAEYSEHPIEKNGTDYVSPWPFESVPKAPIDFQDTKSVICANCHTTINHIAPLFGYFDAQGQFKDTFQVKTPQTPEPIATELSHWLEPGEKLAWRLGQPIENLPDLGKAMAADPAVHECAVARMWNFALGKEDIVSDLSTVPVEVLQPFIDEFESNGQNLKEVLRSMMKSEDFVSF